MHHLVSRGYQRNFANDDHRIAVLAAPTAQLIDPARAIKSNFVREGFNSSVLTDGTESEWLEDAFASVERAVLNQIREVGPKRAGAEQRAAVANLFAIHLVRSDSFLDTHDRVLKAVKREAVPRICAEERVLELFVSEYGREPEPGEIETIALKGLATDEHGRRTVTESMARQHDNLAEMLHSLAMQVVWTEHPLPGFILGDVPVVHANTAEGQFGFRDGLALGDADLVIGPISRRVAVCFTMQRLPHSQLRTKKIVDLVNAVFWRACRAEVACHPDDVLTTQQMVRRLDRLPSGLLHGQPRR
jgi:hypothetical protein